MTENVDILLQQDSGTGIFEIDIDPTTGDFLQTKGFDTSIAMSLFTDKRASASEVPQADLRRGFWASIYNGEFPLFEEGSKLWFLGQARKTQDVLNAAIDHAKDSLQWLVTDNHADSVEVDGRFIENGIQLDITIFRDGSIVESRSYDFWQNTGTGTI